MKVKHHNHPRLAALTKQALKEESCLICTAHDEPDIDLFAPTRSGNNHFVRKHASHLPKKLQPLNETQKRLVRRVLSENANSLADNVDLDATPPTPREEEAIRVIEEGSNSVDTITEIFRRNTPVMNYVPHTEEMPTPTLLDIATSLYLDENDPLHVEGDVANDMNEIYNRIFQPGLQYPDFPNVTEQGVQSEQKQYQHASSNTMDPPSMRNASTSATVETTTAATDTSQMEDVPLLTHGLEHIREIDKMKNVMITQIMHDNVDLLESKLQSRKRALNALEQLFETQAQQEPMTDDVTLELSRIIHLKNKFIGQLLKESSSLKPHVFNVMMQQN